MAKGMVKFDKERCKGCELCVSVCPVKIIALDETRINSKGFRPACVLDADKCIGCANCAIMCPDGAISVFMREEGDEADE
ncbi:MAG: 4Fe-4S dicluster domain-containing protein [Anaerovoracaceae bacterium]